MERGRCGGVHADRRATVNLTGTVWLVESGCEWPLAGAGTRSSAGGAAEGDVDVDVDVEANAVDIVVSKGR